MEARLTLLAVALATIFVLSTARDCAEVVKIQTLDTESRTYVAKVSFSAPKPRIGVWTAGLWTNSSFSAFRAVDRDVIIQANTRDPYAEVRPSTTHSIIKKGDTLSFRFKTFWPSYSHPAKITKIMWQSEEICKGNSWGESELRTNAILKRKSLSSRRYLRGGD